MPGPGDALRGSSSSQRCRWQDACRCPCTPHGRRAACSPGRAPFGACTEAQLPLPGHARDTASSGWPAHLRVLHDPFWWLVPAQWPAHQPARSTVLRLAHVTTPFGERLGAARMIHFMLMVNKHGQTRVQEYYTRCVRRPRALGGSYLCERDIGECLARSAGDAHHGRRWRLQPWLSRPLHEQYTVQEARPPSLAC